MAGHQGREFSCRRCIVVGASDFDDDLAAIVAFGTGAGPPPAVILPTPSAENP